jgi:protein SCO1/2
LIDQDGKPVSLEGFRRLGAGGELSSIRAVRCRNSARSSIAASVKCRRWLPRSAAQGRVKLLSISFDPAFDHAEVLRAHAKKVGADPAVWRFATANEAIVDRLAAEFGINVIREKDGTITHNLRTAVIDPSGHVVSIVDNNAWTADELASALRNAVASAR